MSSNILIVGANGQLGTALQAFYPHAKAVDSAELDITNQAAVLDYDWSDVSTIINAAAYTNVDGAESAEGRIAAWQVNAVGPANLAKAALLHDLTLVHISTDYVFDGTKQNHSEEEAFSPLGVYGQSKAAGDIAVSIVPKHFILRTSWVIGDGKNFVRTMMDLGKRGIAPTVVSDQVGRLTFTDELVRITDHLLTTKAAYGTYNASNSGEPASWADVTRLVFASRGHQLPVTNTTTVAYYATKQDIAPRPLNSVLDLQKLISTGFALTDWQTALKDYLSDEQ